MLDHGADPFCDQHTIDYINEIFDKLQRYHRREKYDALKNLLEKYTSLGTKHPGYD